MHKKPFKFHENSIFIKFMLFLLSPILHQFPRELKRIQWLATKIENRMERKKCHAYTYHDVASQNVASVSETTSILVLIEIGIHLLAHEISK